MYNEDALVLMTAKRAAINAAINGLNRYVTEVGESRWSSSVMSTEMVAVKGLAAEVGADIAAWDGTPKPEDE